MTAIVGIHLPTIGLHNWPWYRALSIAVAERIKQARLEAGLNQTQVGNKLVPPRTYVAVSDIERGKTHITIDLLFQFAAMFGKDIAWFFDVEGSAG